MCAFHRPLIPLGFPQNTLRTVYVHPIIQTPFRAHEQPMVVPAIIGDAYTLHCENIYDLNSEDIVRIFAERAIGTVAYVQTYTSGHDDNSIILKKGAFIFIHEWARTSAVATMREEFEGGYRYVLPNVSHFFRGARTNRSNSLLLSAVLAPLSERLGGVNIQKFMDEIQDLKRQLAFEKEIVQKQNHTAAIMCQVLEGLQESLDEQTFVDDAIHLGMSPEEEKQREKDWELL